MTTDHLTAEIERLRTIRPELSESWLREMAEHNLARRATEDRRVAKVTGSAMFPYWSKAFRKRVIEAARINHDLEREAAAATLEAICRVARKRGWTVRHTSKGQSGRASSRYIEVPGIGEARVSDHEIPETIEREDRAATGHRSRWNGEVVIEGHWRSFGLDSLMRRVLLAAAGRI